MSFKGTSGLCLAAALPTCLKPYGCATRRWLPVLLPSSPLFAWWSLLVLLLDLTYTAVACPVTVAFAPRGAAITWAFILDFVAGLLFTLDVLVQLHVGWHITVIQQHPNV